ncbi:nitrite reductase [Desulfovibrio sp. JC010]|uniref:nitrite reductase n=1 Tax=Desulfovibrio sp. JC010 TaxID=2593641 RepID=UPI0013D3C8A5|nr:nitrite reductase [Desulfovibrio sp. JC010]NDV25255.1 nitrite reductase [Desulfovibrio sp. JC010]
MDNIVAESLTAMPVERKDGTYALRIPLDQGKCTPGMMKTVMETMAKFDLTSVRVTTGQRLNLEGIPKEKLDEVIASLGTKIDKVPPTVGVCTGVGVCKYGVQDSRGMGKKLLAVIKANGPYPFKIKSGVSGCKMVCAFSNVRDIGLVGTPKGWDVLFGGGAARNVRAGVKIGTKLADDEALALIEKALDFYKENGRKRERISGLIDRLGEEALLEAVK